MTKRKRADVPALVALGRSSYVSKRGIAQLANTFRLDGVPETTSRTAQYRARKSVCKTQTPYGTLVQTIPLTCADGGTIDVAVQNPLAMLYHVASASQRFATVMRAGLDAMPCTSTTPWSVILYQDGVDPSDGLSNNHSRKSNVFYWSFLELGMKALGDERNWFPVALGRYNSLVKADGSITQLASKACSLFWNRSGHDLELTGANIKLHGDQHITTIFAKMGCVLADEPAIKEVLACKGHAGTKPCVLCMNAVAHAHSGAEGLHRHHDYPVSMVELDITKFKQHTNSSIRHVVERLHSKKGSVTAEAFDTLEQLYGFNYNVYNLVLHERVRLNVVSSLMWDWCHCFVCDGIADVEFGLFMKVMTKNKTLSTYAELQTYVEGWALPKTLPSVARLFAEAPARNNLRKESFTSSASEFLTLIPILVRYISVVCAGRGRCMPYVMSMTAALEVIELLQSIKAGPGVVAPEVLRNAIMKHLTLFRDAYGISHLRRIRVCIR